MKSLERRREELRQELAEVEQQISEIDKEEALRKYTKVVCPDCGGQGVSYSGGFDAWDPPFEDDCGGCQGRGWLYAVRWRGSHHVYNLEYSEISTGW